MNANDVIKDHIDIENNSFKPKRAEINKRKKSSQDNEQTRKKQQVLKHTEVCVGLRNEESVSFDLLTCPSHSHIENNDCIIEAVCQDPNFPNRLNNFRFNGELCLCYLLHQAVKIEASCDVLDVIYKSFPQAIEKKSVDYCDTVLHTAIAYRSSPEVISYLLDKWPGAMKERNQEMNQPLHEAIASRSQMEVTSLLINKWPDGIKEKGEFLATPLHLACSQSESFELVSLLVKRCPDATKQIDEGGMTPLHIACINDVSPEIVLCLLDKWPEAVKEEDYHGETPLQAAKRMEVSKFTQDILYFVSCLYRNERDEYAAKQAIEFFIKIEWIGGIRLVLERHCTVAHTLHIDINLMPHFLSFVGHLCTMTTMWEIIRNKQELLVNT